MIDEHPKHLAGSSYSQAINIYQSFTLLLDKLWSTQTWDTCYILTPYSNSPGSLKFRVMHSWFWTQLGTSREEMWQGILCVIVLCKWAQCDWVLDNSWKRYPGKQGQVQPLPSRVRTSPGDLSMCYTMKDGDGGQFPQEADVWEPVVLDSTSPVYQWDLWCFWSNTLMINFTRSSSTLSPHGRLLM